MNTNAIEAKAKIEAFITKYQNIFLTIPEDYLVSLDEIIEALSPIDNNKTSIAYLEILKEVLQKDSVMFSKMNEEIILHFKLITGKYLSV